MAQKERSAGSIGGPNLSDSMWADNGETCYFATFTSTSTPTYTPIGITPLDTSPIDNLPGLTVGAAIMRLQGAQFCVVSQTAMAAQTTLNLGIVVFREFAALSAQIAAAGGALTSLPVTPVVSAMPSGQAFVITNGTPTLQTWVTTAAVSPGATSIPVTSQTPSATFPVGLGLIGTVGGGAAVTPSILFGYSSGGSGTPALASYDVQVLPAISANITAGGGFATGDPYGPYLPLIPGDVSCLCAYSAGSVTVSAGCASTLIS